jgi:hypothetical protein
VSKYTACINTHKILIGKPSGYFKKYKNLLEDLGKDRKMILKWTVKKED